MIAIIVDTTSSPRRLVEKPLSSGRLAAALALRGVEQLALAVHACMAKTKWPGHVLVRDELTKRTLATSVQYTFEMDGDDEIEAKMECARLWNVDGRPEQQRYYGQVTCLPMVERIE